MVHSVKVISNVCSVQPSRCTLMPGMVNFHYHFLLCTLTGLIKGFSLVLLWIVISPLGVYQTQTQYIDVSGRWAKWCQELYSL